MMRTPAKTFSIISLFYIALLLISAKLTTAANIPILHEHACGVTGDCHDGKSTKKNIIMMVTDGTGPASFNLARYYRQKRDGLEINDILEIEEFFSGLSRTRSSNSLVTDSAAGATAFACGHKTYNNGVSIDADGKPVGSIMEALKLKGWLTGMVVTTSIADATPAAFSSHALLRSSQSYIAEQQIGYNNSLGINVDLMIGGGRCYYVPENSTDFSSCRKDDLDLLSWAEENGYTVASTKADYDLLDQGNNATLPLLSLMADYDYPYDLDREETDVPSIEHQAVTALNLLSSATAESDEGFFLLIEGSRIDHAGHANSPAAHASELLAYNEAFKAVLDFAENTEVETIIISTSDHECGGLTLAYQWPGQEDSDDYYLWYPEVLLNATHSGYFLADQITNFNATSDEELTQFLRTAIFEAGLGITDPTDQEIKDTIDNIDDPELTLNHILSKRAHIGWTTTGHTGADVNIYTYSNSISATSLLEDFLSQSIENTEIAHFLEYYTNSNLTEITEKIAGMSV